MRKLTNMKDISLQPQSIATVSDITILVIFGLEFPTIVFLSSEYKSSLYVFKNISVCTVADIETNEMSTSTLYILKTFEISAHH